MLPLHTVWLVGVTVITGVGFTVIVKLTGALAQPLVVPVTVKVAITGEVPVFDKVVEIIEFPVPDDPIPIADVLLLQVYPVAPVKLIAVLLFPLHTDCDAGVAFTVGVVLTVTCRVAVF